MHSTSYAPILQRINAAIEASREVFARFTPGEIETEYKAGHDPVTEADRALDAVLRKELLRDGEGWLSEESVDDPIRLQRSQVWVVDPLDGTREFVKGIPEFCVSIGFVENGRPVAGGIYNPATDETFLDRSIPALFITESLHYPASAKVSMALWCLPAAAK